MEDVARSVAVRLDVGVARSVAVLFVHLSKPAELRNASTAAMKDRELG